MMNNIDFGKMSNIMLMGLVIGFIHNVLTYNEVAAYFQAVTPMWSLYMMDYITGPIAGIVVTLMARKYYDFIRK